MKTFKQWQESNLSFSEFMANEPLPIEIDEETYNYFLEVLPPAEYGNTRYTSTMKNYFLVGEAASTVNNHNVYATFGRGKFGAMTSGFWFLGYTHKTPKSLLEAIQTKNVAAQEDFRNKAASGQAIRIM